MEQSWELRLSPNPPNPPSPPTSCSSTNSKLMQVRLKTILHRTTVMGIYVLVYTLFSVDQIFNNQIFPTAAHIPTQIITHTPHMPSSNLFDHEIAVTKRSSAQKHYNCQRTQKLISFFNKKIKSKQMSNNNVVAYNSLVSRTNLT